MWIITGRLKGAAASCARRSASRSLAPATLFDNRALTPTTTSRWRAMAPRARATLARLMSCNSPPGATPVRAMLTRSAADLRRAPRDGGDLIDVVGSRRAGIDPAGHAVLQAQRRPFLAAAGVGVDVDQARRDDLAARIDRIGGVARDVGLDRHDLAAGDRHVADRVEPDRGIDDAPALDDQTRRSAASAFGMRASIAAPAAAAETNWRRFIMVDSPSVAGSSIVSPEAA